MKKKCRQNKLNKYRQAIFVVVYAKTKKGIEYLILKRKHHWRGWEFPKGGINFNEAKEHAARRETKEETGLIARRIKEFSYSGRYLYKKKFADRTGIKGQTFSLYAAEVKKGKVKIDRKEHAGYKWLSFEQAEKKVRFANQKKSLRIVNLWVGK
jgi:8-oxo-dGTP pyrophosphatase MutT (NUDIX family)